MGKTKIEWKAIDTLFEEVEDGALTYGDEYVMDIVAAEFSEYGIDDIDFEATAEMTLGGKAMHIDSTVSNPSHWMTRGSLISFLEQQK